MSNLHLEAIINGPVLMLRGRAWND